MNMLTNNMDGSHILGTQLTNGVGTNKVGNQLSGLLKGTDSKFYDELGKLLYITNSDMLSLHSLPQDLVKKLLELSQKNSESFKLTSSKSIPNSNSNVLLGSSFRDLLKLLIINGFNNKDYFNQFNNSLLLFLDAKKTPNLKGCRNEFEVNSKKNRFQNRVNKLKDYWNNEILAQINVSDSSSINKVLLLTKIAEYFEIINKDFELYDSVSDYLGSSDKSSLSNDKTTGLSASGDLNLLFVSEGVLKRIVGIINIIKEYDTIGKLPDYINTGLSLTDTQHATFYVYLKKALVGIFEKNPHLVYEMIVFLDKYLKLHFDGELIFIKTVTPSAISQAHSKLHVRFLGFWKEKITDKIIPLYKKQSKDNGSALKLWLNNPTNIELVLSDIVYFYELVTQHIEEDDIPNYGVNDFRVLVNLLRSYEPNKGLNEGRHAKTELNLNTNESNQFPLYKKTLTELLSNLSNLRVTFEKFISSFKSLQINTFKGKNEVDQFFDSITHMTQNLIGDDNQSLIQLVNEYKNKFKISFNNGTLNNSGLLDSFKRELVSLTNNYIITQVIQYKTDIISLLLKLPDLKNRETTKLQEELSNNVIDKTKNEIAKSLLDSNDFRKDYTSKIIAVIDSIIVMIDPLLTSSNLKKSLGNNDHIKIIDLHKAGKISSIHPYG